MQITQTKKLIFLIFFVSFYFFSCKKNIPSVISNTTPTDFSQVFDEFWNGMNTNYLYWDIDTTNWDAVYKKYKPVFAHLDLKNKGDLQKSVGYFKEMTSGLVDSHFAISFTNNLIKDSFVFPALERKVKSPNFHSPFFYISIDSNYLDKGFISGDYFTLENTKLTTVCGTIKDKILYFYCSEFALQEAFSSKTNNDVKTVLQYFFNLLKNKPSNIKGIIIDIRNNSGGNLEDLNFFIGHFIEKPLVFGQTHYKSSNGRLSFTPWINAIINPFPGSKELTVPIIVLADSHSISVAEAVTMAIHILPNSLFVGETTWGATGPITDNVLYNSGQFSVPSFLSVYTSSAAFKNADGNSYEGVGFPPDIAVSFNLASLFAGDDLQLDKAISLIH